MREILLHYKGMLVETVFYNSRTCAVYTDLGSDEIESRRDVAFYIILKIRVFLEQYLGTVRSYWILKGAACGLVTSP